MSGRLYRRAARSEYSQRLRPSYTVSPAGQRLKRSRPATRGRASRWPAGRLALAGGSGDTALAEAEFRRAIEIASWLLSGPACQSLPNFRLWLIREVLTTSAPRLLVTQLRTFRVRLGMSQGDPKRTLALIPSAVEMLALSGAQAVHGANNTRGIVTRRKGIGKPCLGPPASTVTGRHQVRFNARLKVLDCRLDARFHRLAG